MELGWNKQLLQSQITKQKIVLHFGKGRIRLCGKFLVDIYKHTSLKMVPEEYFVIWRRANGILKHLSTALPSGCWYAVQVVAPVTTIVSILPLEKHHQGNHKPASVIHLCQVSGIASYWWIVKLLLIQAILCQSIALHMSTLCFCYYKSEMWTSINYAHALCF